MSNRHQSPLRYPGGKASLAGVLEKILYANNLQGSVFVEPFAGGAGAAIKLLSGEHVERIIINDADRAVFCFWQAVMRDTGQFVDRINNIPLTVAEWRRQRTIYHGSKRQPRLDLGFAAFYLNRCNRSGIIKNGGPIGGLNQCGEWRIDARFNRENLAKRVTELADFGDRVVVLQKDALDLVGRLREVTGGADAFVYADPPYYRKGRELYMSHYSDDDHCAFSELIQTQRDLAWVVTYDNTEEIQTLYADSCSLPFRLRYSAHHSSTEGGEILISPEHVVVPSSATQMLTGNRGYFRAAA